MASIGSAFAQASQQARKANEQRYTQGMGLWDEIIQRYQPGGGFGAGAMASYERGKTKAVGAGMQQLVSSGLANTTVAATIGKKYEEEVGTPFKLQLQDVQSQRLTEAQAGKAGFIERRSDVGPDPGLVAGLGQQAGYAQGIQAGGYGGGSTKKPWGSEFSSGLGGFGGRGGGGGGSTGTQGPGYKATRAGQKPGMGTYNPAGLNMEQLYGSATYGEPGGPAGPPAPEGYQPGGEAQLKTALNIPEGIQTRMQNGQLMMQIRPQGYSSLKWVQANQFERRGGQWRPKAGGGTTGSNAPTPGSWTSLSGAGGAGGGRF